MFNSYDDITSRIAAEPTWFDEHSVPRYCEFSPLRCASIHLGEVAFVEIKCQGCRRLFRVALSAVNFPESKIAEAIRAKTLHYGDPPNVRCCDVGPVMNSLPQRVLEYWSRHDPKYVENGYVKDPAYSEWVRDASYEVEITPDWAKI